MKERSGRRQHKRGLELSSSSNDTKNNVDARTTAGRGVSTSDEEEEHVHHKNKKNKDVDQDHDQKTTSTSATIIPQTAPRDDHPEKAAPQAPGATMWKKKKRKEDQHDNAVDNVRDNAKRGDVSDEQKKKKSGSIKEEEDDQDDDGMNDNSNNEETIKETGTKRRRHRKRHRGLKEHNVAEDEQQQQEEKEEALVVRDNDDHEANNKKKKGDHNSDGDRQKEEVTNSGSDDYHADATIGTNTAITPLDDTHDVSTTLDEQRTKEVDRTVFVEGIPFHCTEQDVVDFFTHHGSLTPASCRLPVWQDSGRLRGFGHVVFESVQQKQAAVALSGMYLGDRYLSIQSAHAPHQQQQEKQKQLPGDDGPSNVPSQTLLLKNLPYEATENDIMSVLQQYGGQITPGGIRVVRRPTDRQSKGFAYVQFTSIEAAQKIMQIQQQQQLNKPIVLMKRPIRMDYDHGRIRGSFRTADGKQWHKEFGVQQQQQQKEVRKRSQSRTTTASTTHHTLSNKKD